MKQKLTLLYVNMLVHSRYRTCRRLLSELRRLLTFRKHVVQVFLQLDDPYSYLLCHYLRQVRDLYKIELQLHLTQALQSDYMPQPALLAEYAQKDCRLLAAELGVAFLDKGTAPVVEQRRPLLDFLAEEEGQLDYLDTMYNALASYWRGDSEGATRLVGRLRPNPNDTNLLIARNQLLLRKLGHYNAATMFYAGEWYWGIDRLQYLCARLDGLRARKKGKKNAELAALAQTLRTTLPAAAPASARSLPTLQMYHSFRSPYSYIALQRMLDIAKAFGLKLNIRPVLPMVESGMKVPRTKLLYIVVDAAREARRLGIPFGKIHAPVGTNIERCMAVFFYARGEGREKEFALAAGRAFWANAIDLATDEGLRKVTEEAGLFWPDVLDALKDESWRDIVAGHREALTEAGLWGVPSFVVGDIALWGQDRDWLLVRALEDLCASGDGILV